VSNRNTPSCNRVPRLWWAPYCTTILVAKSPIRGVALGRWCRFRHWRRAILVFATRRQRQPRLGPFRRRYCLCFLSTCCAFQIDVDSSNAPSFACVVQRPSWWRRLLFFGALDAFKRGLVWKEYDGREVTTFDYEICFRSAALRASRMRRQQRVLVVQKTTS